MSAEPVTQADLNRTLRALGLDPSDPEQMREWYADRNFIARQRRAAEQMVPWFKRALLGVILPAVIYVAWEGTLTVLRAVGDKSP